MILSTLPTCRYFTLIPLLLVLAANASARRVDLSINIGGPPVDGFSGDEEILQLGEEAVKTRYHGDIKGHGDDLKVFQTQRFSRYEDLVINIPVPNGIYSVTLMFAETWKGAFKAGKRVFDVYLGSKPGGILKVAESFDPFRSGGPAGPVRRKYSHIATYDGLTVALRPIVQNPQIAGIVISGFSYSEPFIDELPTVAGDPAEIEDFSVLNNIGPRLPVDPLLLYDPGLNPKFKAKKGSHASDPAKTRSSVHFNAPVGRTSVHTEQNLFTPSGQSAGSSPTTVDFSAHKSPTSRASHAGYSSLANHPASLPPLMPPSSLPGLRPGTVRVAVASDGSLYLPHNSKRSSEPRSPPSPTSHILHRNGRRLASIPAENEDQPVLGAGDSPQSTVAGHAMSAAPHSDNAPSKYLSRPPYQDVPPGAISYNHASSQNIENQQTQAIGDGRSERFVKIPDPEPGSEFTKQGLDPTNSKSNQYNQNREESEREVHQAQSGSFQRSSRPISQTEGALRPSKLYSEVLNKAQANLGLMTPPMNMPTLNVKPRERYSETLRGQENEGQGFHFQSEVGSHMAPSGKVRAIPVQAEIPDSGEQIPPPLRSRENNSSPNVVSRIGDAGHPNAGSKIKDKFEPIEHSQGIPYQRNDESGEFRRSIQSTRQRRLGLSDVERSGAVESSASEGAQIPPPVNNAGINSPTFYSLKTAVDKHNEMRNDVHGLAAKKKAAFMTAPTSQNMNTVSNPVAAAGQHDPKMTEMERPERHPASSSRSMESASTEYIPESRRTSSRFRDNNFRAHSRSGTPPADTIPPGVQIGNGKLDGLCIDNSTHCSCGMLEQRPDSQEECLFVVDDSTDPMACTIRPCNGKIVCACASGASALCQRSLVKKILVRAPMPKGVNDPSIVGCKRETVDDGVVVLTPVL